MGQHQFLLGYLIMGLFWILNFGIFATVVKIYTAAFSELRINGTQPFKFLPGKTFFLALT